MDYVRGILTNWVLLSGLIAWGSAQVLKGFIHAFVHREFDWHRLVGDGGMPSGHSATVTAVAATCGLEYGTDTPVFAIAMILAIITCHDAMKSRQEIGKHAMALNELFKDRDLEPTLEEFIGHKPSQVFVGILLGLFISFLIFFCRH